MRLQSQDVMLAIRQSKLTSRRVYSLSSVCDSQGDTVQSLSSTGEMQFLSGAIDQYRERKETNINEDPPWARQWARHLHIHLSHLILTALHPRCYYLHFTNDKTGIQTHLS